MKSSPNRKKILLLIAVTILGMLLNAAPEVLRILTKFSLPVYFLGTVLVTMLCGTFPGMAAAAGSVILQYVFFTIRAMSLPTARMVWHCPFISLFSSANGKVNGPDFREYNLMRLDGEISESDGHAENNIHVEHSAAFPGWNDWKDRFKAGVDCMVTVRRDGNRIYMQTENLGVAVSSETIILDEKAAVLLAITGDQCAITNIRIAYGRM